MRAETRAAAKCTSPDSRLALSLTLTCLILTCLTLTCLILTCLTLT